MKCSTFLFLSIYISLSSFATSANDKFFDSTIIKIHVLNRESGILELRCPGGTKIVRFINGKTTLSLSLNDVYEMRLLTKQKPKDWEDISIIKFLGEPSTISITFSLINEVPTGVVITGSKSQTEKEHWERENSDILEARENNWNAFQELKKVSDSTLYRIKENVLGAEFDSIFNIIGHRVGQYVQAHPSSFFSSYLLYHYHKRIQADSLALYYSKLSYFVKEGNFAVAVFDYLFTLDNNGFREEQSFGNLPALKTATNLFDFSFIDENKKTVELHRFKGKPTLLFFWATWCAGCHKEADKIKELIHLFKNDSINFLSISIDKSFEIFKKSNKKINLPCITLVDLRNELRYFYHFLYVPKIILVDATGKIIYDDDFENNSTSLKLILKNTLEQYYQKNANKKYDNIMFISLN